MEIVRTPEAVNQAIDSMVVYMESLVKDDSPWAIVGIADGGISLAAVLQKRFMEKTGRSLTLGTLNASYHRDDIGSRPITHPKTPTDLLFEVQHTSILLVDDVIHSGRTIRAAMDELFEHGRPRVVKLLVVLDRGHRVLPIQPDFSAFFLDLEPHRKLQVVIDPEDPMRNHIWARSKD